MSPSAILEKIKSNNPLNFELPSETDIRSFISSLIQKHSKTGEAPAPKPKKEINGDMKSWFASQVSGRTQKGAIVDKFELKFGKKTVTKSSVKTYYKGIFDAKWKENS